MKKMLIVAAALLVMAGGATSARAAQDTYIVRVQCGGQSAYQVAITAQTGGDAVNIAKRQNPGCSAVLLGLAK